MTDAWQTRANLVASLDAAIGSSGGGGGASSWGSITGTLASQTDLNTALNGKQPASSVLSGTTASFTTALETKLNGIAAGATLNSADAELRDRATHTGTQAISTISGLQTELDNKAPSSHAHIIADITGLQTALDGKQASGSYANSSHTHAISDITGLQTALDSKAGYTLVATLASNQATAANVTPVTLTGLVFTYAANSTYRIWFMGRVQSAAATTGCGFQFDLSSAVTAINVLFYHQLANTGTTTGGHSIADDASVGVSSGMPGTSTYPVVGNGLLVTGANTGTAQLRFRSETTAVTTALSGFTLVVEKVA